MRTEEALSRVGNKTWCVARGCVGLDGDQFKKFVKMTILILPFTWLHSTPKPTCWASPVEARPGQGPGWTVYRVESAGCKTVLPWSVRTPWVPPTYQSHIYDNCDECEELLCFSLQLTWHKIFHYKLITTILLPHDIGVKCYLQWCTVANLVLINKYLIKLIDVFHHTL